MFIALFEPEIPQNTGNIIRLSANTGTVLCLIEPLGFSMEAKALRRAGLDYHEYASVQQYSSLLALKSAQPSSRVLGFSSKATQFYQDAHYQENDILLFGPETRGLPQSAHMACDAVYRIPMSAGSRSLVVNSVSIVLYEALRQQGFSGLS